MIMNVEWPDVTMVTDEVRQCAQCGESKPANRMYRDLDDDGKYYCGKCAFWSPTPQQESEKESQPVKRKAVNLKRSKTIAEKPMGKTRKFIIASIPGSKNAVRKSASSNAQA